VVTEREEASKEPFFVGYQEDGGTASLPAVPTFNDVGAKRSHLRGLLREEGPVDHGGLGDRGAHAPVLPVIEL
jgi:hypothetical protein